MHTCRQPSRSLACFVVWIKSSKVLEEFNSSWLTTVVPSPNAYTIIYNCYNSFSCSSSEFFSLTCVETKYQCFLCRHLLLNSKTLSEFFLLFFVFFFDLVVLQLFFSYTLLYEIWCGYSMLIVTESYCLWNAFNFFFCLDLYPSPSSVHWKWLNEKNVNQSFLYQCILATSFHIFRSLEKAAVARLFLLMISFS